MHRVCILVADRNPHVRSFLQRELSTDGFHVLIAKDGREVLRLLDTADLPDLLILDIDLPHVSGLEILKKLQDQEALLPVMVHTLLKEYADHPTVRNAAAFVEKTGDNVDGFKLAINDVLRKWYPTRYVNEADREV